MKVYFDQFLGNIFFAQESMTISEADTAKKMNNVTKTVTVQVNTKFTLVARENGKFLYHCPLSLQPAGY